MTAQEIVDRVKKNIGVDWSSDDVDTFKAGDPSTVVTGVVTTSMATLDVLQKAVQAGANLVITAAPTFYSKADLSAPGGPRVRRGWCRARPGPPVAAAGPGAAPAAVTRDGRAVRAPARRRPCRRLPRCRSRSCRRRSRPRPRAPATPPPPDPVYAGKNDFIEKHKLVVFRLTQHWNQRKPDPRAQGLAAAMGWTKYKAGDDGAALRACRPSRSRRSPAS